MLVFWYYLPTCFEDPRVKSTCILILKVRTHVQSEQHLLCLRASDVADVAEAVTGAARIEALNRQRIFKTELWRRWQLGQPVIVRDVTGTIPWDPVVRF